MLLLKPAAVAGTNYAYKWSRSASGNSATSTSVDSSASGSGPTDLIVVALVSGGASSISDNMSNTYTSLGLSPAASDGGTVCILYKASPNVGVGHIWTNSAGGYSTSFIFGFAGVVASPLITNTSAGGGGTNVTTVQPNNITPGFNNTLFVTGVVDNVSFGGGYPQVNLAFQQPIPGILNTVSNYAGAAAYLLQGAGAATNPTWTSNVAYPMAAAMACFKSIGS